MIAGCNGAGKTTASYTILPEILDCKEFVNADEIAKGLSPFQPEVVGIESGRIMLTRIKHLIETGEDFAFETTLSTKSHVKLLAHAKQKGYQTTLLFFWLDSPELAILRVKTRVKEGGHHVPEDVVRRRYNSGLVNFFKLFLPVVDNWMFINNSGRSHQVIAEGSSGIVEAANSKLWEQLKSKYHGE